MQNFNQLYLWFPEASSRRLLVVLVVQGMWVWDQFWLERTEWTFRLETYMGIDRIDYLNPGPLGYRLEIKSPDPSWGEDFCRKLAIHSEWVDKTWIEKLYKHVAMLGQPWHLDAVHILIKHPRAIARIMNSTSVNHFPLKLSINRKVRLDYSPVHSFELHCFVSA